MSNKQRLLKLKLLKTVSKISVNTVNYSLLFDLMQNIPYKHACRKTLWNKLQLLIFESLHLRGFPSVTFFSVSVSLYSTKMLKCTESRNETI